jgi:hypothetical protein
LSCLRFNGDEKDLIRVFAHRIGEEFGSELRLIISAPLVRLETGRRVRSSPKLQKAEISFR